MWPCAGVCSRPSARRPRTAPWARFSWMPTGRISAPAWTSPRRSRRIPTRCCPCIRSCSRSGRGSGSPWCRRCKGRRWPGGLGLALNAHIVVASSGARFGLPEVRIGLWPYVIVPVVAAATGLRKATELALTARIVDAEEACRIGIVDVVVEPGALHERAERIALDLADGSVTAIEQGLSFAQQVVGLDPAAAAKLAARFRREAHASADFREGVLAFRRRGA